MTMQFGSWQMVLWTLFATTCGLGAGWVLWGWKPKRVNHSDRPASHWLTDKE